MPTAVWWFSSRLCQCGDMNFSISMRQRNCLLQAAASNAASVNEPLYLHLCLFDKRFYNIITPSAVCWKNCNFICILLKTIILLRNVELFLLLKITNCDTFSEFSFQNLFFDHLFFIKMPHSGLFFLHFRIFNLVDSKHMFYILICQRLKSNCGHLVSEVNALPTEPQPLSILVHFLPSTSLHRVNTRLMTTTSGLVFILDTQIPEIVPYLFCLNSFVENRFMKN